MKTKSRLRNKGKFRRSYWFHFAPLLYLIISIIALSLLQYLYTEDELVNPCEGGCTFNFSVRAYESPEIVQEPKTIEDIVREVFKDDSEDALKIMFCESRNNPETVGDTHIMSYDAKWGEMVGDSIGLFQVRTGGEGWNRARANGMTAAEFRTYLTNPENNIRYAKTIFDQRGWSGWYNCMNKVLATSEYH